MSDRGPAPGIAGVLLVGCFLFGFVSEAMAVPATGSLRFNRLTIEDGLAQNTVWDVVQDRRGYIWLTTEEGLHRFDGYDFRVFRADPDDPHSISESYTTRLLLGRNGDLWVGTHGGGLNRLTPGTGRFERVAGGDEGLSSANIWALEQDDNGFIWVGTDKGLDRLDPGTGRVDHYTTENTKLRHNRIWSVFADSKGTVWIGTHRGLNYFDPETESFEPYTTENEDAQPYTEEVSVNVFWEDADGTLWVGTEGALLKLDNERTVVAVYEGPRADNGVLEHGSVWAIRRDRRGALWVGTYGGGLLRLDSESGQFIAHRHSAADPTSLGSDHLHNIFEDRTGVLWIGTLSGGASLFDPTTRVFNNYKHRPGDPNSLLSNVVWETHLASDGVLWVTTDGGLSGIDRATGEYRNFRPEFSEDADFLGTYAMSVHEDPSGRLWVGTDYALHRLDRETGEFEKTRFEVEENRDLELYLNTIQAIEDAPGDELWLGTGAGIIRFDPDSGDYRRYHRNGEDSDLPGDIVMTLKRTADGTLWVGTDNGLGRYEPEADRFVTVAKADALSHTFVQTVAKGPDGDLWLGTAAGLNRMDRESGRVTHFGREDGLPNTTIYGILPDEEGHLWMSTNKGLSRLDVETLEFKNYDVDDGLQSNEFNGGSYHRAPDGELFFGGINGLTAFHPSQVYDNPIPPEVAITRFEVLSEAVDLAALNGQPLVLEHWQDILSFEFAAFDFSAPAKNRFRYRLEGFDEEWRDSGTRRHVTYTNLDPGDYRFVVKGANNDGVWSTESETVRFRVLPPFWKTWWAYTGYTMFSIGLVGLMIVGQQRRLRRRHQLDAERERSEWADTLRQLTSALSSSLEAEEVADQLFNHLGRMMDYDRGVLFFEDDRSFQLIRTRGVEEKDEETLQRLPATDPDLIRRMRETSGVDVIPCESIHNAGLTLKGEQCEYLGVPLLSRSNEFGLLLIGRAGAPFQTDQRDIVSAFTNHAVAALDNARLFSEVQNLATTDSLTRMNNRRYFLELAEVEFNRIHRYQRKASLMLIDADHFKYINDTWGHEVGDRALKAIAYVCRTNLRQIDISGRYGGEEFIVMLPETSLRIAREVAERLRQSIEQLEMTVEGERIPLRASVGLAPVGPHTPDLATLIRMADGALYKAKRQGRNRVCVAEPDADSS